MPHHKFSTHLPLSIHQHLSCVYVSTESSNHISDYDGTCILLPINKMLFHAFLHLLTSNIVKIQVIQHVYNYTNTSTVTPQRNSDGYEPGWELYRSYCKAD